MPSLPPVSALLNPALDAVRERSGAVPTREINAHVAAALGLPPGLALAVPGGDRFRAAMREARAVLETAGLLEEREGHWSLAPGVAGWIADPDGLVAFVRMWSESRTRDPLELADWRVHAANDGTFDPEARIAAARLRGREAVAAGAPLRAELERIEIRLRRMERTPPAQRRPAMRGPRSVVTPGSEAWALLREAELLLGLMARPRPPRSGEPPVPRPQPDAGPHGPPPTARCPGLGHDESGRFGRKIFAKNDEGFGYVGEGYGGGYGGDTVYFNPAGGHGTDAVYYGPAGDHGTDTVYYGPPPEPAGPVLWRDGEVLTPDPADEHAPDASGEEDLPWLELPGVDLEESAEREMTEEPDGTSGGLNPDVPPPQGAPSGPEVLVATPDGTPPPATGPDAAPEAQPAAAEEVLANPPKPPRYPDFRVLREDGREHDAHRPLTVDETYALEVRVTPAPEGLPTSGGTPREAVIEPGRAEPVTLMVTVDAASHVEVYHPVDSLILPPEGPSTAARFEFRVREAKPARLRVRIYYRLNLLARARVVAEAADEVDGDDPRPEPVVVVEPEVLDPSFRELSDVAPRDAHIDVTLEDGAFTLTLAFRKDQPGEARFRARLKVKPPALEDALVRVREVLAGISAEPLFNRMLEGTQYMRARHLRTLAAEGRRLWGMLFDQDIDGAASELARMLKETPLPPDSRLQVSLERGAEEFVFPWALLFPGELPEEPQAPPADAFWGTRYELEVRTDETRVRAERPLPTDAGVKLAFALHPFDNAAEQAALLARLEAESGGKLRAGKPLQVLSEWETLLGDCDAHILYFYTHGYTRQRKADIAGTGSGGAPAKDADRDADRSYIELPNGGRLYLDELLVKVRQPMRSEPLVFLNMCESAQMTPSLSEGLVDFFLDRGARAVIGTECPMTIYFAHPFAERVLSQLLRGDTVGRAMLDARRHFVEHANNVLGFAYSLYGTAALSFAPPLLPAPAGD